MRKQDRFYRILSGGQHTARKQENEVKIYYPYHPRYGQNVKIISKQRHQGEDHAVIEQPDGSYALLPIWMTLPNTTLYPLLSAPRVSLAALRELKAFISNHSYPEIISKNHSGEKSADKAISKIPADESDSSSNNIDQGFISTHQGRDTSVTQEIDYRNVATTKQEN